MAFLKLAFQERPLKEGEDPVVLFGRVKSRKGSLLQSSADGRYSIFGYDPFAKVWSKDGVTQLLKLRDFCGWKKSSSHQIFEGDALDVLRTLLRNFHYHGKSPAPFFGGTIGYFSYDYGCSFSGVQQKVFDDLHLPDFVFFFYDKVVVFDHEEHKCFVMALAATDQEAQKKIPMIFEDLQSYRPVIQSGTTGPITSNLTYEKYAQKIGKIHEHLVNGDTYQVNFSQRFSADCTRDIFVIYERMSEQNPAPYACYFEDDDFQIVSATPELLLKVEGGRITTKPIKGTVPRGKTAAEDKKLASKLLKSQKDAAELNMIVDLERNDFGKVCEPGSVKVLDHRNVEKYASVLHTVSTVEGKLQHNKDFFDAFRAVFPGGSITGCPKKRSMQIIDEVEDFKRGVYTGSAGYIGFNGDAQMNILIRTVLFKDGKLFYHAGGGIVIDSEPKAEYEETLMKVSVIREILEAQYLLD